MPRNKSTKEMYYNPSKPWSLRVDGGPTYQNDFGVGWKNGCPTGTIRRDRTMRRLHYEKFVYHGVFDLGEMVEFESDDGTDGVEPEEEAEYVDGVGFDDADVVEDEDGDYNNDSSRSEEGYEYSEETESENFHDSTDNVEDEEEYESTDEVDHQDDPDDPDAETEHYVQENGYDA